MPGVQPDRLTDETEWENEFPHCRLSQIDYTYPSEVMVEGSSQGTQWVKQLALQA